MSRKAGEGEERVYDTSIIGCVKEMLTSSSRENISAVSKLSSRLLLPLLIRLLALLLLSLVPQTLLPLLLLLCALPLSAKI